MPEPTAWMSVLPSIRYGAIARQANVADLLLIATFVRGTEMGHFWWFGWAPLPYLMEFVFCVSYYPGRMSLPPCQRSALYLLWNRIPFIPRPLDDPRSLQGPTSERSSVASVRPQTRGPCTSACSWKTSAPFARGSPPCAPSRRALSCQEIVT